MVVIPLEKYEKLISSRNKISQIPSLEVPIPQSLEVANSDKALTTFGETSNAKDKDDDPLQNDNLLTNEDIVQYMPKCHQHRCRVLLFHMKNNAMTWDAFGRLMVNDECVMNTHVVDLVKDMICNYKKPCSSVFAKQFFQLLIGSHCPRSILNKSWLQDGQVNSSGKKNS